MNYKKIVISLSFLACGVLACAFFKQTTLKQEVDQLIIGMAAGYAPFVSINPQGEYEGFDIDAARALAQQMGKKLVLKDLGSMASLFVALDQGTIDAIMWGLSITPERLKKVAMIHYQGAATTTYPLLFWKTIPEGVRTLSDMQGKLVCVEPGSSQDGVLSRYELINKLPMDKVDDALMNIQYGKADAALVEPAIAKKFKNKFSDIQCLDIALAPEDHVQGIGIVLKQDTAEMIKAITQAVQQLKEQGVITQLEQKWGIES